MGWQKALGIGLIVVGALNVHENTLERNALTREYLSRHDLNPQSYESAKDFTKENGPSQYNLIDCMLLGLGCSLLNDYKRKKES